MSKSFCLILLCVSFSFTAISSKSFAMSCKHLTTEEAFNSADAVFEGRVVGIKDIGENTQISIDNTAIADNDTKLTQSLTLKVNKAWKGLEQPEISIMVYGRRFVDKNANYLVFANKSPDAQSYQIGFCSPLIELRYSHILPNTNFGEILNSLGNVKEW